MTENDDYRIFKAYMSNDEYIVWKGKPEKGHLLAYEDILVIPFSIIWCGGALLWTFIAFSEMIASFILIGIFFSTVGLYISIGRFVHKIHRRKNTRYVITNKKVLVCYKDRISVINRSCIFQMHMKTYKDGNGNIIFTDDTPFSKDWDGILDFLSEKVSLQNISDVYSVYKILAEKPH